MSLPVSQINPVTLEREILLDISSVSIKSIYNEHELNVEWTFNDTILILDAMESIAIPFNNAAQINHQFGFEDEKFTVEHTSITNSDVNRIQRSFVNKQNTHFNPYLQKVIKSENMERSLLSNGKNSRDRRSTVDVSSVNDRILANLPSNRTIYFDCKDADTCLEAKFRVSNIKPNNFPILITLNFTIDMTKVARIMTEQKDILVVQTSTDLIKTSDEDL